MKKFYSWYKKHITAAIFTGLILGIITGLFLANRFEPVLAITSLIGSIYMNALNMMIFPLVFCSIIMGISSIGNARTTGKITAGAMIFFLCTTALASLAGLIIPRLIHLGEGVKFEMATSDIQATEMTSILDTIKNLIPSNPVAAFANGNMLQVLVFAVIVGFTLIAIGEKGTALLKVIDSCNEVCLKVISTVMYFTPIGVFCTIVPVVEANGTETIISLATQLIILYVAFFGFALVIYGGSVKFIGKESPVKFFKAMLPAALNAFGTCSSSATIPISKQRMEDAPSCFRLFRHCMVCALFLALFSAGRSIPASIAIIAMTIRSSIRVKLILPCLASFFPLRFFMLILLCYYSCSSEKLPNFRKRISRHSGASANLLPFRTARTR